MAEFCLECFNKYEMNGKNKLTEKDVIMSNDFCEGCAEFKPCVIRIKKRTFWTILISAV